MGLSDDVKKLRELNEKKHEKKKELERIEKKAEENDIELPDEKKKSKSSSESKSRCDIKNCHRESSYSLEGYSTDIEEYEELDVCSPCKNAIERFHGMDTSGRVLREK